MPVAASLYYFVSQGEAIQTPPVILIHGAGGNHLYWPPELRRLPGYRVYAIDLPGHGKSAGHGQQSIAAYAESILTWLEAVGLHQAVFVGHSMGSAIALTLALHHPEHVLGIGLVSAGARLKVHPLILENTSSPATFHKAVETLVTWYYGPAAPSRLLELAAKRLNEIRPAVMHGDLVACNEFNVINLVASIHKPTLVICGAEDQMTPLRYSQFLAGAIPGARLDLIPQSGHMVMIEQPQAVSKSLVAWLAGISSYPV